MPDSAPPPVPDEPRIDRRSVLAAGALAVAASPFAGMLLGSGERSTARAAVADPAVEGSWSPPFAMGGVAIHATLTHVGDVLFFGKMEGKVGVDHTSYAATWNYRTGATAVAQLPYDRDIFCAHQNVLPDGRVYITGGHDHNVTAAIPTGVPECDVYDPVTRRWTRTAPLRKARWYPTNIGLADGRTLIFGGHHTQRTPSNTVEEWNPATGVMRTLPASATKGVGLYPRMHLMGNGTILRTGPSRATSRFDPATNSWTAVAPMVWGNRVRGLSLLLHGGTKVLSVGGASSYTAAPTATAEVLDTAVARPVWRATGSMAHARMFHNGVLLPDGTVLVIGGGKVANYSNPVLVPEMWNPATGRWSSMAPHVGARMYHSTALLLPDGRVLAAGQDFGAYKNFGEVYSPPYLFKGARPTVTSSPARAAHGSRFTVRTPQASSIRSVMLIRSGSVTHMINTDQRALPLAFTAGAGSLTITAPGNRNLAPSGYYMLFLVDGRGVPSVAPWLRIG